MKTLKIIKLCFLLLSIIINGNLLSNVELERVDGEKIDIAVPKDEVWTISDLKEAVAKKLGINETKKIHLMRIRLKDGTSEVYENKDTELIVAARPKIVITDAEKEKAKSKYDDYKLVFQ